MTENPASMKPNTVVFAGSVVCRLREGETQFVSLSHPSSFGPHITNVALVGEEGVSSFFQLYIAPFIGSLRPLFPLQLQVLQTHHRAALGGLSAACLPSRRHPPARSEASQRARASKHAPDSSRSRFLHISALEHSD